MQSTGLRELYKTQDERYAEQRANGRVNHSEFASNYMLLHFGFYDYPTRQPSPSDLKTRSYGSKE